MIVQRGDDDIRFPAQFRLHSFTNLKNVVPEKPDGIHPADHQRRPGGFERQTASVEIVMNRSGPAVVAESGHVNRTLRKVRSNNAECRASVHFGEPRSGQQPETKNQKPETVFHVRILVKKYNPAIAKSTSGLHAASAAGNKLMSPSCSNSFPIAQYAMAIPKLTPTPAVAPRVPARNANGTEISAITSANSGT